jgi:hypothetical protein
VYNGPLPANWSEMDPIQRSNWLQQKRSESGDISGALGPGGGVARGWHRDRINGGYTWIGYAGQSPDRPPPKGTA